MEGGNKGGKEEGGVWESVRAAVILLLPLLWSRLLQCLALWDVMCARSLWASPTSILPRTALRYSHVTTTEVQCKVLEHTPLRYSHVTIM